jgi:hypothetical protein
VRLHNGQNVECHQNSRVEKYIWRRDEVLNIDFKLIPSANGVKMQSKGQNSIKRSRPLSELNFSSHTLQTQGLWQIFGGVQEVVTEFWLVKHLDPGCGHSSQMLGLASIITWIVRKFSSIWVKRNFMVGVVIHHSLLQNYKSTSGGHSYTHYTTMYPLELKRKFLYHTTSKKRLHTKLKKPNWKHSNL